MQNLTAGTVDAVHDTLDSLVLSVFEAIRGHEVAVLQAGLEEEGGEQALQAVRKEKAEEVHRKYVAAVQSVQSLAGLDTTPSQQEEQLQQQSQRIQQLRERILTSEGKLLQKKNSIDAALSAELSDQVLGLQAP
jgi:hypothetical protein